MDNECDMCFNHSLSGVWLERKDSSLSVDVELYNATNVAYNGLGERFIAWVEDTVYFFTTIIEDTTVLESFAREFIFCDYDDDWFCRTTLVNETETTPCCSDRCEERGDSDPGGQTRG